MLKLEIEGKNRVVSVRLRDRERMLSRSFFIALAIALSLHLGGALFFKIQPFRIGGDIPKIPPVIVDADITILQKDLEGVVFADLEQEKKKGRGLLMPPPSIPVIPKVPKAELSSPFINIEPINMHDNPFARLENTSTLEERETNDQKSYLPVNITLGGPIAELEMLYDIPDAATSLGLLNQYTAKYEIRVDNATGEIVWVHLMEGSGDSRHKQTDAILQKIRFQPSQQPWLTKGVIEVTLNEDVS